MKTNNYIKSLFILILLISLLINFFLIKEIYNSYKKYLLLRNFPFDKSNQPIKTIHQNNKKLLVLFGDSRITGWQNFPESDHYTTVNAGFAGYTSEQLKYVFNSNVIELQPKVVILQFGINDLVTIGVSEESYSRVITQLKNNISFMLSELEKYSIKTILMTIIPNRPISLQRKIFWSEGINQGIEEINHFISQLNNQHLFTLQCNNLLSREKLLKDKYAKDDLHLNSAGYSILNACLLPYIQQLTGENLAF